MRMFPVALLLLMLAPLAPAVAQEPRRPDPLLATVAQSIGTASASVQMLVNAYEQAQAELAAAKARLEWFDAYFKPPAPPAEPPAPSR